MSFQSSFERVDSWGIADDDGKIVPKFGGTNGKGSSFCSEYWSGDQELVVSVLWLMNGDVLRKFIGFGVII